jgi:uncharacterized membrane protein YtjA (UPF0391 family)
MSLLKWALIMLVVSLIAALFGFTNLSAASADVARILFYIFLVIFLVLLVLGLPHGDLNGDEGAPGYARGATKFLPGAPKQIGPPRVTAGHPVSRLVAHAESPFRLLAAAA